MDAAKLQLSSAEMALVSDPGVILTKNSILAKVVGMMAELSDVYRVIWREDGGLKSAIPPVSYGDHAGSYQPKISKGENYKGLPYVMLDYPRLFGKENVLAIRTMFWWGHAFIITLHLKGRYRDLFVPVIKERWASLAAAGFHIGISEDEWQHEHAADNYQQVQEGDSEKLENALLAQPFLKISAQCKLDQWNLAPEMLESLFRLLVSVIGV